MVEMESHIEVSASDGNAVLGLTGAYLLTPFNFELKSGLEFCASRPAVVGVSL
jgi:hypothetical protein